MVAMIYLSNQAIIMFDDSEITFDMFYKLYPRKVGRFMANKSFNKLKKSDRKLAFDGLLDYLKFWKHNKTEKQFIPHPSTWLNQRRWEDEIDVPKTKQEKTQNVNLEVMQYRKKQQQLLDESADTNEIREALSGFLGRKKWKKIK